MSKLIGKIVLAVISLSLAAAPLRSSAQDMSATNKTKAKPATNSAAADAKARPLPFTGKLGAVDNTAKTITLDEKTKRTFQITSETRLMKDGKPATLTDAVVGDEVRGSYKKLSDGKLAAVSVNFGAKTAAAAPTGKSNKGTNSVTNAVSK